MGLKREVVRGGHWNREVNGDILYHWAKWIYEAGYTVEQIQHNFLETAGIRINYNTLLKWLHEQGVAMRQGQPGKTDEALY